MCSVNPSKTGTLESISDNSWLISKEYAKVSESISSFTGSLSNSFLGFLSGYKIIFSSLLKGLILELSNSFEVSFLFVFL